MHSASTQASSKGSTIMKVRQREWIVGVAAIAICAGSAWWLQADTQGYAKAIERTRKQVRMLDDLYKTAVVLITDKYVHRETDFSAGSAAVALFAAMKKNGWHEVRLVDATGQPFDEKNLPQGDFEQKALTALRGSETYLDEVVEVDGQRYLHAATPVPVVSKKCIMCHPHYADEAEGKAIGFLSYKLKVE
jgi:hypothetical protein